MQALDDKGADVTSEATIAGAGGPLMLYLKLCGLVSVVLTSPLWLYQIWAFILPGLHAQERKWSRVFAAVAGPLFLVGVTVGYLTLPKGLEILIGLTPGDLTNLVEFGDYLTFLIRTLLVFGIAFEIPVFVILLNLAGRAAGQDARRPPAVDRDRHVRLRRDRDALDRPVHHADPGRADAGPVRHLRGDSPDPRPAAWRGRQLARLADDEVSPL